MLKKIIRFFKSVKLAVVLIIILAVIGIIGIFVPQVPASFAASSDGYEWWIDNVAYSNFGTFTNTFEAIGFFNIFKSFWFIATSVLLWLNIFVCSVMRIKAFKADLKKIDIHSDAEFYSSGKHTKQKQVSSSLSSAEEAAYAALKKNHYSYNGEAKKTTAYIAAEKNRYSMLGTIAVHLSLLVLIISVLAGALFGFKDEQFVVTENAAKEIGYKTGLTLYLESFSDEYWEDGTPKDYSSEVELYSSSELVKSAVVRVNHPLSYNGVRIYQSFFGPAAGLNVVSAEGETIIDQNVALTGMMTSDALQRPQGSMLLPGSDYSIVIISSAVNAEDPTIGENEIGIEFYDGNMQMIGWMKLEKDVPQDIGGLVFTYTGSSQYSGFIVKKNPGSSLIWVSAILFLWGLGMVFYFPHRKVWIAFKSSSKNKTSITVRMDSLKEFGLDNDIEKILSQFDEENGENKN